MHFNLVLLVYIYKSLIENNLFEIKKIRNGNSLLKIGVTALMSAPQSIFLWSPLLLSDHEVLTNDQNLIEAIDFYHTFAVKIVKKNVSKLSIIVVVVIYF